VPRRRSKTSSKTSFDFIDLFAGIGGIRRAFESIGGRCVFTSEWNKFAVETYRANFEDGSHHAFAGDIKNVKAEDVPDHDVLLAGFPCQPFSLAGVSKKNSLGRAHGFDDETQGTLFFDVARIIAEKRPRVFLLENVKNLVSHDKGRTFEVICKVLTEDLGYSLSYRVMDSSPWVPQRRQRIIIVGYDADVFDCRTFDFDSIEIPGAGPDLGSEVLHPEDGSEEIEEPYTVGPLAKVNPKYTLSPRLWGYLREYAEKHRAAGNGFGYGLVGPDDVARTMSARYYKDGAEILVNRGPRKRPRRLTPRECARLMGFPEDHVIPVSDVQAYRQFGNSVVVPMVTAVAKALQVDLVESIRAEIRRAS
jgi:DNA (cytosine-5)-methyltransferase 1